MEAATNSLSNELEAMAAIGRALGDLTDPAARERVLRWACERFTGEVVQQAAPSAAVASVAPRADADLAVDSLRDMFAMKAPESDDDSLSLEPPRAAVETEKTSIEATLRTFAAEFQRFADEWNGAAA